MHVNPFVLMTAVSMVRGVWESAPYTVNAYDTVEYLCIKRTAAQYSRKVVRLFGNKKE